MTRWCGVSMLLTFEIAARWLNGRLIVAERGRETAALLLDPDEGLRPTVLGAAQGTRAGDASLRARPN